MSDAAEIRSFFQLEELSVNACQAELLTALRDKRRVSGIIDVLVGKLSIRDDAALWDELLKAIRAQEYSDHRIWLWSRKLRKAGNAHG
ncbi:MAG: hypothetical protein AB9917_02135 [Negativicutes bacterium]